MAETPDAIAKRWFDEVWNKGDETAIDRMMHPQGLVHGLGRPVDISGITMFRVKDGLIVEGWNCFDFLTLYQQLGWVGNPVLPQ